MKTLTSRSNNTMLFNGGITIMRGKDVVVILAQDGTLTFGAGYSPTAAADTFWGTVSDHMKARGANFLRIQL